jgi:hypothetical protein
MNRQNSIKSLKTPNLERTQSLEKINLQNYQSNNGKSSNQPQRNFEIYSRYQSITDHF